MALPIIGNAGVVWEVEPSRAGRVTLRPTDVGALGSYAAVATSGTIAAGIAANSPVFSWRWGDSTRLCLIRKVAMAVEDVTTAFAATKCTFDMIAARGFTASDTGGTALTLTGNNAKRRTSFGTSLISGGTPAGDARISSTATLTAGTRTLDTHPLATLDFTANATANAVQLPMTSLWTPDWSGEWPLVLAQNEGFVIQVRQMAATGTWALIVNVEWTEIASF